MRIRSARRRVCARLHNRSRTRASHVDVRIIDIRICVGMCVGISARVSVIAPPLVQGHYVCLIVYYVHSSYLS